MAEFNFKGIPVKLANEGHTIMMLIRSDYEPEAHMVVFANPKKLSPYMDAINAGENPNYVVSKHADAKKGLIKESQNANSGGGLICWRASG